MGSLGTLPVMGGHPKFGNDPQYTAKAGTNKFHPTAPDPKKLVQGSPQPSQTMGSPGTFPLMGGHP